MAVVAAVAAAAVVACRPGPGLGTATYIRAHVRHTLDLATCRDRVVGPASQMIRWGPFVSPDGSKRATVRPGGSRETIVVRNLRNGRSFDVYRGPRALMLFGWSPDSRWILFAVDPMGSASLAADGLTLRAVPIDAGGVSTIGPALLYDDYRTWCGGRLFMTLGGDRIATTNKRLVVISPPLWRPRTLTRGRAWGSVACAPDGRSVVVQSQATSNDANFFHTRWSLWQVGADGSQRRLTKPPGGYADESPRFAGDTLFFVRSRRGVGTLYALRDGRLLGPFASLGYSLGYYGHNAWSYTVSPG
jgi:hypothetical protein